MSINENQTKNPFTDLSLWFLLFSNIVTIFIATAENWKLSTIMWVYWFQSATIGFFNFIRIIQTKEFSNKKISINEQPTQISPHIKYFLAFFFLFHFGFFQFGYLIFLLMGTITKSYGDTPNLDEIKYILLTALIFFINHLFSYLYNKSQDTQKQNIISLMVYPYARIVPMHLTIILGSLFGNTLPLFLVFKTFADTVTHVLEHSVLRKSQNQPTQTIQENIQISPSKSNL
jgi:hypothetical protein